MAKTKQYTAEEFAGFMEKVRELSEASLVVRDALSKVKIDDIPNPPDVVRELVLTARDLNQLALQVMSRHELQQMRANTAEMVKEKMRLEMGRNA